MATPFYTSLGHRRLSRVRRGDKLILSNALILNRTLGEAVSSKMDDMLFLKKKPKKKTTHPVLCCRTPLVYFLPVSVGDGGCVLGLHDFA